jgi:bifunctional aspartokinase / homoserine dehydrogenase 1
VLAQELLPESLWESVRKDITQDFDGLRNLLQAVVVMKADDERLRELVSGHGEVWSAKMITALFNSRGHNFHCIDARKVLVVKHTDVGDGREVQWVTSHDLLAAELARAPVGCHLVITGFIASTTDGVMTTLRRDGRCVCV